MAVHEDIYMPIRSSQIFYGINSTINQKLCSKWQSRHSHGSSCCRNSTAGCQISSNTTALCTVAICRQLKIPKICTASGRLLRTAVCLCTFIGRGIIRLFCFLLLLCLLTVFRFFLIRGFCFLRFLRLGRLFLFFVLLRSFLSLLLCLCLGLRFCRTLLCFGLRLCSCFFLSLGFCQKAIQLCRLAVYQSQKAARLRLFVINLRLISDNLILCGRLKLFYFYTFFLTRFLQFY